MKAYRGVSYNRNTGKYYSTVRSGGIKYNCGSYDTDVEAAKARDKKVIEKGLKVELQVLKPVKKQ